MASDTSNAKSNQTQMVDHLQAVNGIEYLHELPAQYLALKIDVVRQPRLMHRLEKLAFMIWDVLPPWLCLLPSQENFEFKLLRDLIASGAICRPRRPRKMTHLLVEFHVPRPCPTCEGGYRHMFNATIEGLPASAVRMSLAHKLSRIQLQPKPHAVQRAGGRWSFELEILTPRVLDFGPT